MLPLVGWHATILHFLISHDTTCITVVPWEIEDNAYANFGGKTRSIMEDVQMAIELQFERKWFLLGWLHKGFQGQHLPCLSINFVVINKDLEKLPTQLY